MKIGIIGAGAIGQKQADAAFRAGALVSAVADPNFARAQDLADRYGSSAYATPDDMFADPDLTAVVIGVPNRLHRPLAIAAMEAGKDVLLEKPMALSAAECDDINETAQRTGRILQLGFVHRYTGVARLAKSIVAERRLGAVYHAKAQLHLRRGVPGLGRWFTNRTESGGGCLMDVGVHLIDLALHVLEFPAVDAVHGQVYGNFGRRMQDYVFENMWAGPPNWGGVCDVEDAAHALIRFASGATLGLDVAWAGNFPAASMRPSMMGFFGDAGGIAFELFGTQLELTTEKAGQVVDEQLPVPPAEPFVDQLTDFFRSVETRQPQGPTGREGQVVQSIVDDVYQSSMLCRLPVDV